MIEESEWTMVELTWMRVKHWFGICTQVPFWRMSGGSLQLVGRICPICGREYL